MHRVPGEEDGEEVGDTLQQLWRTSPYEEDLTNDSGTEDSEATLSPSSLSSPCSLATSEDRQGRSPRLEAAGSRQNQDSAVLQPGASSTPGKDHHSTAGTKREHPLFPNPAAPGIVTWAPGSMIFRHLLDAALRMGEYTNSLRNAAEELAIVTRAVTQPNLKEDSLRQGRSRRPGTLCSWQPHRL